MAITLTERAANRARRFIDNDTQAAGLRLAVRQTGCSGWAYIVDIAKDIDADDAVFEDQGVKMVVDSSSLNYLDGSQIDYRKEGLNETFKFDNPNAKAECGCGESFSV